MGFCRTMIYIYILFFSTLFSQNNNFGGGPNMFYDNMYTAREVGMGGAGISSAEGYMANLWNPANIVNSLGSKKTILGFNIGNVEEISKEWFSTGFIQRKFFKKQQKEIYLGASIISETYNDLIKTTISPNNEIIPIGRFNLNQNLFLFSIAGKFDAISLGLSGKAIYSELIYGQKNLSRFGVDIGFILSYPKPILMPLSYFDKIKYGFVLKSDFDNYNKQLLTGVGASVIKEWSRSTNTTSFDLVTGDFHVPEIHLGTDFLFFRKKITKPPYNEIVLKSDDGKKYYKNRYTFEKIDIVESRFPIFSLYGGIAANKESLGSFNTGVGFNLPKGLKLDIAYSFFEAKYLRFIKSQIRFTIHLNLNDKKI